MREPGDAQEILARLLEGYPPDLAAELGRLGPGEDAERLAEALLSEGRVRDALGETPLAAREFLAFIARAGGEVAPAVAEWWLRHRGADQPSAMVEALAERGLLFYAPAGKRPDRAPATLAGHVSDTRGLAIAGRLWTPEPVARIAAELCPARSLAELDEPFEVRRGTPWDLVRDLFILVRFLAHRAPRLLTTSRNLSRAYFVELAGALRINLPPRDARRMEDVPDLLWLRSVAGRLGLADEHDRQLVPSAQARSFFETGPSEQQKALLEAAVSQTGWGELEAAEEVGLGRASVLAPDDSDAPSPGDRVRARRHVLRVLAEVATPGQWHSIRELAETVIEAAPDFLVRRRLSPRGKNEDAVADRNVRATRSRRSSSAPEPLYRGIYATAGGASESVGMVSGWLVVEGTFVAEFLKKSLHGVGVIDIALSQDGPRFRVSEQGARVLGMIEGDAQSVKPPGKFFVQPNFEIIADGGGENIGAIWRLSRVAEMTSFDVAAMLTVTRESIVRGLDEGMTREEIIGVLSDQGRVPVPQNVEFSVREWVDAHERYELRAGTCVIETDDEEELARIEEDLPGCLERLGPTTARVLPEKIGHVEEALARRDDVLAIDHGEGLSDLFTLDERMIATPIGSTWHWYPEHVLSLIADPAHGRSGKCRLTRDSVRRGLDAGLSGDEIERFVRGCAQGALSPAQTLALRGWIGRYEAARLASATVLSLPVDAAEYALAVPEIREQIIGWIAPSVFVVRSKGGAKVKRLLEKAGITVEKELPAKPLGDVTRVTSESGREAASARRAWGRRRWKRGDSDAERLELIGEAIEARRRLLVEYESVVKGEPAKDWILSPQTTETSRWGQVRLHGYCHQRETYRTFDVSRMNQVILLDEEATYPPADEPSRK